MGSFIASRISGASRVRLTRVTKNLIGRSTSTSSSTRPTVDHAFCATILQFKSAIFAFSASVQACPPF